MSSINYRFLNHIDAPRRILTLTLDEFVVCVCVLMLLIVSAQKILVSVFGMILLSSLRFLKNGDSPRVLLVLAYWYLPHNFTQFFLPKLPLSHHRIYLA